MEMRRINVTVSGEAAQILDDFQRKKGLRSKDKALDALLLAVKDCKELN